MRFRLSGQDVDLTSEAVLGALRDVAPEPIRSHAVLVNHQLYPAKQAVAVATGLDRLDFTTANARRVLQRLGFELVRVDKELGTEDLHITGVSAALPWSDSPATRRYIVGSAGAVTG